MVNLGFGKFKKFLGKRKVIPKKKLSTYPSELLVKPGFIVYTLKVRRPFNVLGKKCTIIAPSEPQIQKRNVRKESIRKSIYS